MFPANTFRIICESSIRKLTGPVSSGQLWFQSCCWTPLQILPLNITLPVLARLSLSPLSGVIAYLLSYAFPCKLHFPNSDHPVSRRVQPMGGIRRLQSRMEGGACALSTLSLCCGNGTSRSQCISSTTPAPAKVLASTEREPPPHTQLPPSCHHSSTTFFLCPTSQQREVAASYVCLSLCCLNFPCSLFELFLTQCILFSIFNPL